MILSDRFPPLPKIRIPKVRPAYPFPIYVMVDPWADQHGILLIGTNQDANDLYYDGFDESMTVDPRTVQGYDLAMTWLKVLPNHVLRAMEPQYNHHSGRMETKAIYFSTAPNRGYAMIMPHNYVPNILECVRPSPILEQGVSEWSRLAIHEVGHIVDFCGVNRHGYYWEPIWPNIINEMNLIFDAKGDVINPYAHVNPQEDFAVHFAFYVWKGGYFRQKALTSIDLQERYNYLRDTFFLGVEYEEAPTGTLRIYTSPIAGPIYVNENFAGLGSALLELSPGWVTVSFGDVEGWHTPAPTSIEVIAWETRTLTVGYAKITPPLPPPTAFPWAIPISLILGLGLVTYGKD